MVHVTKHRESGILTWLVIKQPFAVAIALSIILSVYLSPYLRAQHIKNSMELLDIDALSRAIDFPTLRRNLEDQFHRHFMASKEAKDSQIATILERWNKSVADSYTYPFTVDQIITRKSHFLSCKPADWGWHLFGYSPPSDKQTLDHVFGSASYSYDSLSRFVVTLKSEKGGAMKLVLTRSGLWSWRLTNILLPENLTTSTSASETTDKQQKEIDSNNNKKQSRKRLSKQVFYSANRLLSETLHLLGNIGRVLPDMKHLLSRTLDGAILLTVLTQILSLTDFFLLPAQKKRFEDWCNNITSRLSFVNTATWLQRWICTSRRAQIGKILFWFVSIAAILGVPILMTTDLFSAGFNWWAVGSMYSFFVLQCFAWVTVARVFDKLGTELFGALSRIQTTSAFVYRYLLIATAGFAVIALTGAVFYWIGRLLGNNVFSVLALFYAGSVYIGLIVTWLLFFLDGLITLLIAILVWPARLFVILAQWFMRRVSSYPKGPLAALTAIVAAVLAVVRFIIK